MASVIETVGGPGSSGRVIIGTKTAKGDDIQVFSNDLGS